MFKQAIIYAPKDEKTLKQIHKDLAVFRCSEAVKYIEALNLNDAQIDTLYESLAEAINIMRPR